MEHSLRRLVPTAVALSLVWAVSACSSEQDPGLKGATPSPTGSSTVPSSPGTPDPTGSPDGTGSPASQGTIRIGEVASDLDTPWGLAFLPDGTGVLAERDSGRVLLLPKGTGVTRTPRPAGRIDVAGGSETGLLGVAVSPDFATDRTLFFYVTTDEDNRVLTATLDGETLGEPRPILTGIPTAEYHSGGRLAFGPDGMLYVSTGDARDPLLAQDRDSLAGKILRITPSGDPAPGNPWDSEVWSLGHRNVQGLAFDTTGQLWASEFGENAWDELNRIERGGNYGWPYREGKAAGVEKGKPPADAIDPVQEWSTDDASPSGLAFFDGSLWMAALRGERLWQIPISNGATGSPTAHLTGDLGRLRTVIATPDSGLWVTTSNTDGRSTPRPGDDRILQVSW